MKQQKQAVNKSAEQTCKLYGRTLAAGLAWHPPASALAQSVIRSRGEEGGFALYARHRIGKSMQIGYAEKGEAHADHYSLAAALAKAVGKPNWIAAFRLPDTRYGLVAVHHGAIMPGRDRIGPRGEIEAQLRETVDLVEAAGDKWDVIYAPKEFETAWPEKLLTDLLPKTTFRTLSRLASVGGELTARQRRMIIAAAAALALAGACAWVWSVYEKKLVAQAQMFSLQVVRVAPPHPWLAQPPVQSQLAQWNAAMARLPMTIAGWRAQTISLSPDGVLVDYARQEGMPIDAFVQAARELGFERPNLKSADSAQLQVPAAPIKAAPQDDHLAPAEPLLLNLASYFQGFGMEPPTVSPASVVLPPMPSAPLGSARREWGPPDWSVFKWQLHSELPPDVLFAGKVFPGMRVTRASLNLSDAIPQWELSGVLYAQK